MNKRYYNEETTLDGEWYGYKIRLWIVNPYQEWDYTTDDLYVLLDSIADYPDYSEKLLADDIVELIVENYDELAAVQVIRPDGVGHMAYTTEYNGDSVDF